MEIKSGMTIEICIKGLIREVGNTHGNKQNLQDPGEWYQLNCLYKTNGTFGAPHQ